MACYIKSKANHVSFNKHGHWHSLTSHSYANAFLPQLPASVIGYQPLPHLNFSPYHPSYLPLMVSDHTLKRQSSPVTGLERPRGFQQVKVPTFHDNGTGWW